MEGLDQTLSMLPDGIAATVVAAFVTLAVRWLDARYGHVRERVDIIEAQRRRIDDLEGDLAAARKVGRQWTERND